MQHPTIMIALAMLLLALCNSSCHLSFAVIYLHYSWRLAAIMSSQSQDTRDHHEIAITGFSWSLQKEYFWESWLIAIDTSHYPCHCHRVRVISAMHERKFMLLFSMRFSFTSSPPLIVLSSPLSRVIFYTSAIQSQYTNVNHAKSNSKVPPQ